MTKICSCLNVHLNTMSRAILILMIILGLSGTASASISYTLNVGQPSPIYTGDSTVVSVSITNENTWFSGRCAISLDSASWSTEYAVNAGKTITLTHDVSAPPLGSGSGSQVHTIYSYCYSTADSTKIYQSTAFTLTYTENPSYIAQNEAQNAIASAKKIIDSAVASKVEAQNAINDAKNTGADIRSAQTFLDSASSKMDSANNKYNEANSYFTNSNWNDAKTSATQAESYANDASSDAGNAKSIAIQAKQAYVAESGQTKSKLDSAQSSYNNVVDTIDKTKYILEITSSIGVATSDFSNQLEKVSSTLLDAKAELDKAETRYESNELSESRTYSENSLDITEKDITILKDAQNKMALAAIDKLTANYSSTSTDYDSAMKTLNDTKAKITGDVYATEKEKLDLARKSLDNASNLMAQAKSYANDQDYSDAITSAKGASSELTTAESLSGEIKPPSTIPSFDAIFVLIGVVIAYLAVNSKKRRNL